MYVLNSHLLLTFPSMLVERGIADCWILADIG
jgi:hypothetical protein